VAAAALVADGTLATTDRPYHPLIHKMMIAAVAPDGTPLAVGHHHPASGTTGIGGIGALPVSRRRDLAAAVMTALATHARDHGLLTAFLACAEEAVAGICSRPGFRRAGVILAGPEVSGCTG
jgi:hypothetical protein